MSNSDLSDIAFNARATPTPPPEPQPALFFAVLVIFGLEIFTFIFYLIFSRLRHKFQNYPPDRPVDVRPYFEDLENGVPRRPLFIDVPKSIQTFLTSRIGPNRFDMSFWQYPEPASVSVFPIKRSHFTNNERILWCERDDHLSHCRTSRSSIRRPLFVATLWTLGCITVIFLCISASISFHISPISFMAGYIIPGLGVIFFGIQFLGMLKAFIFESVPKYFCEQWFPFGTKKPLAGHSRDKASFFIVTTECLIIAYFWGHDLISAGEFKVDSAQLIRYSGNMRAFRMHRFGTHGMIYGDDQGPGGENLRYTLHSSAVLSLMSILTHVKSHRPELRSLTYMPVPRDPLSQELPEGTNDQERPPVRLSTLYGSPDPETEICITASPAPSTPTATATTSTLLNDATPPTESTTPHSAPTPAPLPTRALPTPQRRRRPTSAGKNPLPPEKAFAVTVEPSLGPPPSYAENGPDPPGDSFGSPLTSSEHVPNPALEQQLAALQQLVLQQQEQITRLAEAREGGATTGVSTEVTL